MECTNKKLISVIMPTYNAQYYLREALDSICNQTYKDWEMLVVDDHSTDDTLEILKEYVEKDHRIKIIAGPGKGIGGALNAGIEKAEGYYIARMDADDVSLEERFEKQVEYMNEHIDVEVCAAKTCYLNKYRSVIENKEYIFFEDQEIKANMLFSCVIAHPSIMFRRTVFDRGWRYNEKIPAEDYNLWTRMIPEVKFACLPEVLLQYRTHDNNASKQDWDISVVQKSAKQSIERVFELDLSKYKDYFFGFKGTYQRVDIPFFDYAKQQIQLMLEIDEVNSRRHIFNTNVLRDALQNCWMSVLSSVGIRDDAPCCVETKYKDVISLFENGNNAENVIVNLERLEKDIRNIFTYKKHFVLYGMGRDGKKILLQYRKLCEKNAISWQLDALIDGNLDVVELDGKSYSVSKPEWIRTLNTEYVLISTDIYFEELRGKITGMGIAGERILPGRLLLML